jgi:hypothetical protein
MPEVLGSEHIPRVFAARRNGGASLMLRKLC